jgi:uncharacterized membrane protein (DUF485 family)
MTLALLSRQRWRIAIALGAVMVVVYFGFVLLIAFDKSLMAQLLVPGLSLGVLLGALVIVATWVVTWIYVRWANSHMDRRIGELRAAEPRR